MSGQTVPEIEFRTYDHLPEEAVEIRREVFMDERGHEGELDDVYGRARHIVAFLDGRATATCRLFAGSRKGELVLGRLAVRRSPRGHHLGARTLAATEAEARSKGVPHVWMSKGLGASGDER